ncbi:MAG TPA: site-2 protease family protein [Dehalococcoidia bacterium]
MLLTYSDLLKIDFLLFATFFGAVLTALVAGISIHECSHAFTAWRLGDPTAKDLGRVSLNPMRHLEPFGTMLMLMVGFGWGRPTPVNPNRLRNGPHTGRAMVAAAGPISNLLLAALASIPIHLGLATWHSPFLIVRTFNWDFQDYLGLFLSALLIFNVVLAVFNLLPIAPLDGFSVAVGILPRETARSFAQLEQYGPMILMFLFFSSFISGGRFSLLGDIMSPVINGITEFLSGSGGRALG